MILVSYTKIAGQLPPALFNRLVNKLPPFLVNKNLAYRRWEDRHLNLFGKLLLMRAIDQFGLDRGCIDRLSYNQFGKPYLQDGNIDFNISHSGAYAVCAMSNGSTLGIDIEQVKEVDTNEFRNTMSAAQWKEIEASVSPLHTFYRFWTIKESVLKADSRGLSIPLTAIFIEGNRAVCMGSQWYIKELVLDEDYITCLATSFSPGEIRLEQVSFAGSLTED